MSETELRRKATKTAAKPAPRARAVAKTGRAAAPAEDVPGAPGSESTNARAQRRRVLIKAAVSAVLERVGYRAMKVTDVAAEAGIATGLFYHYFPDLRTATCEVLSDFIDQLSARVDALPRTADRFEIVYRPTLLWAEAYEQHAGLMRCLFQVADEVPEFEALWFKTNDAWTRRIARSLVREFPDAGMSDRVSLSLAYALGSMIDGLLNEIYVHRNPELRKLLKTPAHAAELLSAIWYRAVYMQNPPADIMARNQVLEEQVLELMNGARQRPGARA
ncbi:TetR/AcrR family transcriptional regulator [Paucibacter sp. JuS9]|uniref:TetR/AcrR family transcriptional regulator n=1 Tax=Paucibacter sp. JuS9 TaxID=3228748 RepID=UPI0037571B9B